MAPYVRPWKAPLKAMMWLRPVARRASLRAPSTTSAPELPKKTVSSPSGISSTIISARRVTGSRWPRPLQTCRSWSTWAWMAALTRGWAWPSEVTAMPLAKSR